MAASKPQRLTSIGDDLALVIDRPILEATLAD